MYPRDVGLPMEMPVYIGFRNRLWRGRRPRLIEQLMLDTLEDSLLDQILLDMLNMEFTGTLFEIQ